MALVVDFTTQANMTAAQIWHTGIVHNLQGVYQAVENLFSAA
ncbi:MAG: hypothetical protein V3S24_07735 [Candidatus Tectomicrobia bacterium]